MRRVFRILPAIAVMAIVGALMAAGDEDAKPKMSMVIIEKVRPSMSMQYEDATKEMCSLLTEHGADPNVVSFWTASGPELGYAFVIPLPDGFNSMESTHESWMAVIDSIGMERFKAVAAKADACVESRSMVHSAHREDLSYTPENPALKQEDIGFIHYTFLYTFAHTEHEFEAIAKEWQALYASKGIRTGWHVYQQVTGDDLPLYVIATVGKSEADFHANRVKIDEKLGEAAKELGMRSQKVIRRVKKQVGHPRPDLSFPTQMKE
jgi:hypothetical protein